VRRVGGAGGATTTGLIVAIGAFGATVVATSGFNVVAGANVFAGAIGWTVVEGVNVVTTGATVVMGVAGLTVVLELRAMMHERFPLQSW
jgi:hypothetical protein